MLFTLPLELRIKIYGHVLNTGVFDEETQSHVYKIGPRRQQRRQNLHSRVNNYTITNIKSNHFALLSTCWTIFTDITSCVNITTSFSFANPDVLASFACGPLATVYCRTRSRDKDFAALALRVLKDPESLEGHLRVLAFAQYIEVVKSGRYKSVDDMLGRAMTSLIEEDYHYFR